jgi:hypothetical protein
MKTKRPVGVVMKTHIDFIDFAPRLIVVDDSVNKSSFIICDMIDQDTLNTYFEAIMI